MTDMVHYLLVYDHNEGRLVEEVPFTSGSAAVRAYNAKEHEYGDRGRIEVVLVGSDSIETIRRTHANYFDGIAHLNELLEGI